METPDTICTFWFGPEADEASTIAHQSALWWSKRDEVDGAMRSRFAELVERAALGQLEHWLDTARGRLALILLTDQFPRNIWRGQARAFAFDPLALGWTREVLRLGLDRECRLIERVFLYLPLEHSENRADQAEAVRLFAELAGEAAARDPALALPFDGYLDYARSHQAIIDRFGRFPHRNALLGRASTADEIAFLQQPGSSF